MAATRAQEHLVLSGATDLERLKEPGPLDEPMRWLWRALAPELPRAGRHVHRQASCTTGAR